MATQVSMATHTQRHASFQGRPSVSRLVAWLCSRMHDHAVAWCMQKFAMWAFTRPRYLHTATIADHNHCAHNHHPPRGHRPPPPQTDVKIHWGVADFVVCFGCVTVLFQCCYGCVTVVLLLLRCYGGGLFYFWLHYQNLMCGGVRFLVCLHARTRPSIILLYKNTSMVFLL